MGIVGPKCPAMSQQHSFTYSMLCDHQRGALTDGHRDQDGQLGILWECLFPMGVSAADSMQILHVRLNNDASGL